MTVELTQEDIKMLKQEFGYIRCMYWDRKLPINFPNDYCDGDCHHCKKKFKIDVWLKDREIR